MAKNFIIIFQLLIIIANSSNITYLNYYISSTSDDKDDDLLINVYLNSTEQAVIFTSDNFDSIKINGNANYLYGSTTIEYIYNCNTITLYSPSFFLYWGNQQTPFEFEITCKLKNKIIDLEQYDLIKFEDSLYIYLPGIVNKDYVNVTNYDLLYSLINQTISRNFTFTLSKDFDFNKYFFGLDTFNQGTEFYIGKGFEEFGSNNYIIFNRFITINAKIAEMFYINIREFFNITNNETYEIPLIANIIHRNFYTDNTSLNLLENILVNSEILWGRNQFIKINYFLFINLIFFLLI